MIPPLFHAMCEQLGLGVPEPEYRFDPERKWRFDWAWPLNLIAMEIEGGAWIQGRHNRGSGFLRDMEKYNRAACLGWRVLRCTPQQFASGEILADVAEAINGTKGGAA